VPAEQRLPIERDDDGFKFNLLQRAADPSAVLIVGNRGSATVQVVQGVSGDLTFIETTGSGNVNVTTVFAISDAVTGVLRPAVHSRHHRMLGLERAYFSQWIGWCQDRSS